MPRKAPTPCRHFGCRTVVAEPGFCTEHAHDRSGWVSDKRRGSRHARGYGAAWTRQRELILKRDGGLCQPCLRARRVTRATQVDHIKSRAEGGTDDESNLQSICEPCHKAKTARESARARLRTS
ncbi:HNH endonuclease [Paraburkholderia fungorum]|uniref:HNH endonuclease n=1 Tax=Paraburkholderia fungorum TaxID=134537 RepID=UPI0038BA7AA6